MADLDDFFAKKDKKKTKSSKKFITADEIVKSLEESKKSDKYAKKDDQLTQNIDSNSTEDIQQIDDDEWKDYKEEKKDYTGLKIGKLVSDVDNLNVNDYNENPSNCDPSKSGEANDSNNSGAASYWKPIVTPAVPEVVEELPSQPPVVENKPKKYMAPALRGLPKLAPKTRSKTAPDIHSEDYFPTLKPKSSELVKKTNKAKKKTSNQATS